MLSWKRFAIVAVLAILGTSFFWLGSRYPDLDAKAVMANDGSVADVLSVWPLIEVSKSDPLWKKTIYSTINWVHGNLQGMLFGVLLGTVFLTLIGYLKVSERPKGFRNTIYGFLLGSPLGVCVNCAAPVFKGILKSRQIETAFAAMISSPTMNMVVLTMVFSLFPFYMGMVKVLFTCVVIFIGIPLISKLLGPDHKITDFTNVGIDSEHMNPAQNCPIMAKENFLAALQGCVKDFSLNLKFLAIKTVPLMLLAGFIGSLLSHVIPLSWFSKDVTFVSMVLVAIIGVLLPVPIAFDVILANAIYSQGFPVAVVLTLLCTLGIYSIYSFFIVWTSASRSWAVSLLLIPIFLGFGIGFVAEDFHHHFYAKTNVEDYHRLMNRFVPADKTAIDQEVIPEVAPEKPKEAAQFLRHKETEHLLVERAAFEQNKSDNDLPFKKKEGYEIGISQSFRYGIRDYTDPFWIGRGTGAGDYNKDGWEDLVLGSNVGFHLYKNRGGWFEKVDQTNKRIAAQKVYYTGFIDLNNDGWLDLFYTTWMEGNFVILNQSGSFDFDQPIKIPNNNGLITISPAFGDIDGNGDIDIVNGNMALGIVSGFADFQTGRANSIVFNQNLEFRDVPLETKSGETMASLVSDLNNDGLLDIYFCNDFIVPDKLLLGTGAGFHQVKNQEKFLPATPTFSMSVDTGDLNNDLLLDLHVSGTINRQPWVGKDSIDGVVPEQYAQEKWTVEWCDKIKNPVFKKNCIINRETNHLIPFYTTRNHEVTNCKKLQSAVERQDCLLSTMWMIITSGQRPLSCLEFNFDKQLFEVCKYLQTKGKHYTQSDFPTAFSQINDSFVFLSNKNGSFRDINRKPKNRKSKDKYRHPGGWTWSSRIVDLDHDGWQDIFNAEGTVRVNDYGFNVFMKNMKGQGFEQRQFSWGLTDDFNLFGYVIVDFDRDGDVDIIGNSSTGPVQVYENFSTGSNHSVKISLNDLNGNRYGIGGKIFVKTNKGTQVREIKSGGGYLSADPSRAWFGLGEESIVKLVRVKWRDGAQSVIEGPLEAGYHYRITRKN